jgi:hypothetical protein
LNRSSRLDTEADSGFQLLWEDSDRVFCRGPRQSADGSQDIVLAVMPAEQRPIPSSLGRLFQEFALKDELDGVWAVRPLELRRDGGRAMLLLEDPDAEPLDRLIGAPLEPGQFLHLAIGMVTALGKAHQRGLVHKDVKPANIRVNRTTGEVRLTGFGIASRLPRERQASDPPETISGTLAYIAPKQTGRMNRSIDSHSDLYALGMTLYQMLTGVLPFAASDPMEWVHCHIARKPVPPHERSKDVSAPVSAIVMKLVAKTAEERYQTAGGVERDLRRCLVQWETQGVIRTAGGKIAEIGLAPLAREHLGQLVVDALRCEPQRAAPLARLVHAKTNGNPFLRREPPANLQMRLAVGNAGHGLSANVRDRSKGRGGLLSRVRPRAHSWSSRTCPAAAV